MDRLSDILLSGGMVTGPLILCNLLLWFCLGDRFYLLCRIHKNPAPGMGALPEYEFLRLRSSLGRGRVLISAVVTVAPLLGLLGTVDGMIETFDSLGEMSLFSGRSGGVAGGIGRALVSTQIGLLVAVPGLLLGRMLNRREDFLAAEWRRLREKANAL